MTTIHSLPNEILLRIASYLGADQVCSSFGTLSRAFNVLSKDESLWKTLCISAGLPRAKPLEWSWHTFYLSPHIDRGGAEFSKSGINHKCGTLGNVSAPSAISHILGFEPGMCEALQDEEKTKNTWTFFLLREGKRVALSVYDYRGSHLRGMYSASGPVRYLKEVFGGHYYSCATQVEEIPGVYDEWRVGDMIAKGGTCRLCAILPPTGCGKCKKQQHRGPCAELTHSELVAAISGPFFYVDCEKCWWLVGSLTADATLCYVPVEEYKD